MSDPRQDRELLAWASAELQKAQLQGIFGTVTFHLHGGTIVRSETNQQNRPDIKQTNGINGKQPEH